MKSDDYVTHKELDSERRLNRVETSERIFWWFFSTILAVLVAALIGIFTLLFQLQDQVSEIKTEVVEINSQMDKIESLMDKIEIRMDNIESLMDKIEIRMWKVETHLDNVEIYFR